MKYHNMIHIVDPGHGWLRVTQSDFKKSGVKASSFSYEDAHYVYLEEDADATMFLRESGRVNESIPTVHVGHNPNPIGYYPNPREMDRIYEADPDECECGECDYCYDKKHGTQMDRIRG